MITHPWHPTLATDRAVYHNDTDCPEGAMIAEEDRRPGEGGRPQCEHCAQGRLVSLAPRALPETGERRCPACESEATAPVGHVLAAAGMMKVQRRWEACGAAFFFVRKPLASRERLCPHCLSVEMLPSGHVLAEPQWNPERVSLPRVRSGVCAATRLSC
jgi:hypothetical protein